MGKKKPGKSGLDAILEEKPSLQGAENGTTEEEEFEVEKVVDKRINKGKVEYLLKWKGYPAEDNTWESEESLECPELLRDYGERRRLEKKSVAVKKEKKEKKERNQVTKVKVRPRKEKYLILQVATSLHGIRHFPKKLVTMMTQAKKMMLIRLRKAGRHRLSLELLTLKDKFTFSYNGCQHRHEGYCTFRR